MHMWDRFPYLRLGLFTRFESYGCMFGRLSRKREILYQLFKVCEFSLNLLKLAPPSPRSITTRSEWHACILVISAFRVIISLRSLMFSLHYELVSLIVYIFGVFLAFPFLKTIVYPQQNMAPSFTVIATAGKPILHRDDFWLTEAPVHDEETGLTWFTDIPRGAIYSFDIKVGQESLKRIEVGEYVGCLALIEGDKEHLAVGAKRGFGKLNIETGGLEYYNILYPDDQAKQDLMRINDGTVDVKGRYWAAAMRSFGLGVPQNEGAVFCSDTKKSLRTVKHPVAGPNGFAFSPDNSIMYFVETRLQTIFSYDYDPETGSATNETEFIKFDPEVHGPGAPDGIAISQDGDLWVAVFNGNKVIRFDSKTKDVKGIIEVPTSKQVACPAFIGEGLVITTGKLVHMDPEVGKGHSPDAGDVFYVPLPGIKGAEVYKVRFD